VISVKKTLIILIVVLLLCLSGCLDLTIRREREDPEETNPKQTEETTPAPATIPVIETTPVPETTPEPTPDPNAIVFDGITVRYDVFEEEYRHPDDDAVLLLVAQVQNATVEIPAYPAAAALINDTLNIIRTQDMNSVEAMRVESKGEYDEWGDEYFYAPYEWQSAVEPIYVSGRVICFRVYAYMYYGGAHGGVALESYAFDTRTGDYLTLDDLCSDAELFRDYLQTRIIDQIEAVPIGDRMFFEDYAMSVVSEFSGAAWIFQNSDGDEVLIVNYQEYAIAPYAAGLPEFIIPIADCIPYFNAYGQSLFQGS
jgi:hypothetical protein